MTFKKVGEAGTMPGTTGFTCAAFIAESVPVGTELFAVDFCEDEGCDHHGTPHICRESPWSTDLEAAPLDRDVLVYHESGQYFVARRQSGGIKGLFCYAVHRGAFLMCRPTKWREIPA
ncbi:hypothetical protein EVB39_112 [Rhizobium phage RHph_TM3_3_9]|nr:hypothetical protein EVB39_112 [Rhizobium phage RHph_TM3_3_9]QIG68633.1 hypothetical protein EVB66_112 [Rhizobium phage RHph_TM3_3_13]QIG74491.1 hypothetical protein EVC09_111 [Rhizobium phage RHph_TM3_3_10]QXV74605.1 hypothetical protein [Rhizobium phage RHEph19]